MISLLAYNVAHVVGAFLLMTGLGALAVYALAGYGANPGARKLAAMAHGVGLLLILVAGFGQLARLDLSATSGWVLAKVVIWLLLGAAGFLMKRSPKLASLMLLAAPLLGGLAVWLGVYKP